jgi:hypothetical protein
VPRFLVIPIADARPHLVTAADAGWALRIFARDALGMAGTDDAGFDLSNVDVALYELPAVPVGCVVPLKESLMKRDGRGV